MSVEVKHDGDLGEPGEPCVFCRKSTHFWYTPKDVACCPSCAKMAEPKDFPSKTQWCRRETIARGPRFV